MRIMDAMIAELMRRFVTVTVKGDRCPKTTVV